MSQATMRGVINGVDVDRLDATIQAIRQNPGLGTSQFRAVNRWISGGHNRSTIQGFYGAGQEDTTCTQPFVLDADEPPVLLGKDQGANPVEFVLHALTACLTTSLVYYVFSCVRHRVASCSGSNFDRNPISREQGWLNQPPLPSNIPSEFATAALHETRAVPG